MTKFIPLLLCSFIVVTSANAQIYLRKETQGSAQQQVKEPTVPPKESEPVTREKEPSTSALTYAQGIANACLSGQWETQPCLKAVSENNLVMASNYAAALAQSGRDQSAENIKQNCAASTAATRDAYPANAMRSAYVECVNTIVEESSSTNILPDQSQFQLIVSAVQCLDGAPSCAQIEQGLANYR